jgi:hypothetical protein
MYLIIVHMGEETVKDLSEKSQPTPPPSPNPIQIIDADISDILNKKRE